MALHETRLFFEISISSRTQPGCFPGLFSIFDLDIDAFFQYIFGMFRFLNPGTVVSGGLAGHNFLA